MRRAPIVLALISALSLPAFAADTSDEARKTAVNLDAVVVTATGFEQKITEAPASISVITREDLATRPYMTLIDAVRDLEGVDVGETSDKTGQKTISMRGMGSDYTLVLIDGKRQNNHGDIYPNNFGGNQFGHLPPLEMIERIEVIRGPASTLYGADALGGVINIITRKVGLEWNGSLTATHNLQENSDFGTDSTFDFALSGPLVADKLGLGLRGAWYDRNASTPEYEVITAPDGTPFERSLGFGGGGKTVDNTNRTAGLTLSWTPSDNQSLTFDIDTSKQTYDNTPYINNLGTETYPLGTVDGLDGIWRSAPRVGYAQPMVADPSGRMVLRQQLRCPFPHQHGQPWSYPAVLGGRTPAAQGDVLQQCRRLQQWCLRRHDACRAPAADAGHLPAAPQADHGKPPVHARRQA